MVAPLTVEGGAGGRLGVFAEEIQQDCAYRRPQTGRKLAILDRAEAIVLLTSVRGEWAKMDQARLQTAQLSRRLSSPPEVG